MEGERFFSPLREALNRLRQQPVVSCQVAGSRGEGVLFFFSSLPVASPCRVLPCRGLTGSRSPPPLPAANSQPPPCPATACSPAPPLLLPWPPWPRPALRWPRWTWTRTMRSSSSSRLPPPPQLVICPPWGTARTMTSLSCAHPPWAPTGSRCALRLVSSALWSFWSGLYPGTYSLPAPLLSRCLSAHQRCPSLTCLSFFLPLPGCTLPMGIPSLPDMRPSFSPPSAHALRDPLPSATH